jgi:hypothetical protein
MPTISNAPNGADSSIDGTEKIAVSGSKYALISSILEYIRTATATLTGKTINLTSNTLSGTTAQFNTALSDNDFATLAGSENLTNKTLTTPTISGAISFPDGVRQTFNPDGTNAGLNVGSQAGDPGSPSNGDLWYDSTANELTARINGSNVALGTGSGLVDDTAYDATTWNGDTTHAPSKNAVRDKIEAMGSASPSFFGLVNFTAPSSSGWSWDNQVSSTIDSTNGYEYLAAPRQSAVKLSGRYRTPANSHWRIEVCMLHDISGSMGGTANDTGYVIGFRDSGAKLVTTIMQVASSAPGIYSHKWTSSTSYSALYTSYTTGAAADVVYKNPAWLRADYDGTNIVTYYSIDGNHWVQIDTRTLTDFLAAGTPNFFWGAYVNGCAVNVALISYNETALA